MEMYSRQFQHERWQRFTMDRLIEEFGIWSPLIVDTQEEKDFLEGVMLVAGIDDGTVLLDGKDFNTTGMPPTFFKVAIRPTELEPKG